ncbi:MAG: tyrosinase family protein [Bacteroidota bacterium]|nr:tyrosinase family protein [Bacteroidota bacterium]
MQPAIPTPAQPAASATWLGNIRCLFTEGDVDCMNAYGLDLTNYGVVRLHAQNIYQQVASGRMPKGGPAWPQDQVATFFAWMNNDFPMGTGTCQANAQLEMLAAAAPAGRLRQDVTTLTSDELTTLKKAFAGIMALPITDPNSYFVQAGYHWLPVGNTYCQHHVPGYNPWHRAYLLSFENALRSIPGCEQVTLPYWDVTTPVPSVFQEAPFDSYTIPVALADGSTNYPANTKTTRYDDATIQQNLLSATVTDKVNKAMSQPTWEGFHGLFGDAANNTIISAHDNGHNSIGDFMGDQDVAAFDPIFWFFHANWDRLFWQWQNQTGATTIHGLLTTMTDPADLLSRQVFTNKVLELIPPFSTDALQLTTLSIIDSVASLDVDYINPPVPEMALVTKTQRTVQAAYRFSVDGTRANVRVAKLNRLKIPGSFTVHLTRDGEIIASTSFFQPNEVEKCENCVQNAIVHFDFELPLAQVSTGKLGILVEPRNKTTLGDTVPASLMGNPTVEVHLLLGID